MIVTEKNSIFDIDNKKNLDPAIVEQAFEWYKKFTGKQYSSSDIKELVEIYTELHKAR